MRVFLLAVALVLLIVFLFFVKLVHTVHAQEPQANVAEITVFGEIRDGMAIHAAGKLIAACEEPGNGPILIVLNGPGGDIDAGGMIIDAMQHCTKHPVNTLCIGACQSMDAIIFEYGKTRTMWPRAFLMLHNGYLNASGSLPQVANQVKLWNSYIPVYEHEIAARAGMTYEQYRALANDQWYVRADDAVKAGLADAVQH